MAATGIVASSEREEEHQQITARDQQEHAQQGRQHEDEEFRQVFGALEPIAEEQRDQVYTQVECFSATQDQRVE